jgi:uncharacterized protein YkwD
MRPVPLPSKARIFLLTIVCVLAVGAARPAQAGATPSKPEIRLLHVMNNARAAHGLVRLRFGSTLQTAAHSWAVYLRHHNAFYHGRLASGTSENIGWLTCRSGWASALVRMWLNSATHREHLLDRSARRVGVGVARGPWSGFDCVRMAVTRFR